MLIKMLGILTSRSTWMNFGGKIKTRKKKKKKKKKNPDYYGISFHFAHVQFWFGYSLKSYIKGIKIFNIHSKWSNLK